MMHKGPGRFTVVNVQRGLFILSFAFDFSLPARQKVGLSHGFNAIYIIHRWSFDPIHGGLKGWSCFHKFVLAASRQPYPHPCQSPLVASHYYLVSLQNTTLRDPGNIWKFSFYNFLASCKYWKSIFFDFPPSWKYWKLRFSTFSIILEILDIFPVFWKYWMLDFSIF